MGNNVSSQAAYEDAAYEMSAVVLQNGKLKHKIQPQHVGSCSETTLSHPPLPIAQSSRSPHPRQWPC
jgi:hypothetical protein